MQTRPEGPEHCSGHPPSTTYCCYIPLWASTMLGIHCVGYLLHWVPTTLGIFFSGCLEHVSNSWNRSQFLITRLLANYTCDQRKIDCCWLNSCLFQPSRVPPIPTSPLVYLGQAVDHIDQNNTSIQTHTYPSSVNTILTRILQPFTTLYI